jgi:dihydrofolate synthase/folylpolyglutamate synthase
VNVKGASLARRSEAKEAVPRPFFSYQEALAWLYGLQRFGIKLGLENIRRLIAELSRKGDLQIAHGGLDVASASCRWDTGWKPVPHAARVIHVAGTNGKGSVCAMIDAISRARGYRTGLFTSPHLVTFRERIRVNGEMISESAVASGLNVIRDLVADWDPHPTFFEITTALALKYFSEVRIGTLPTTGSRLNQSAGPPSFFDLAADDDPRVVMKELPAKGGFGGIVILETGLGGRLDATNAIQSDVAVITRVDLDHQKWLGESLEKIAGEKAGIIKPNVSVVSAGQEKEVEVILRKRAAECEVPIQFVDESYDQAPMALRGAHQKQNAAVAIAALRAAKIDIDGSAIARGLMSVEWPARFQQWDDRIIIDGAHNPGAARVLAETWREIFGPQRATLILAILSDKDLRGICEALAPISHYVLLPKIRSERAAPPNEIAQEFSIITPKLQYSITASIAEAIDAARAKPHLILLTGSLHFAGEALAYLREIPAAFEECAQ